MIRLVNCNINRYRSILSMSMNISSELNLIAICGQNNVGKTNTLRAINLFFHPETYDAEIDMPKIKRATGGQSTHPKIELTFYDDKRNKYFTVTRNFQKYSELSPNESLTGFMFETHGKQKQNKQKLTASEIVSLLEKLEFENHKIMSDYCSP